MADVPTLSVIHYPGLRVLEQPTGVVRDGMTMAIEQVLVYPDRVELVYTIRDIPHAVLFDPMTDGPDASCDGPASYANLMLPDGMLIHSADYLLDGKAYDMFEPTARTYLVHIFPAAIPEEISELKMILACIGLTKLDRSPQNWEIPFRIVPVGG